MTLLDSLLDAIVRLDGDSLVMHVGEKPYVVTTSSAMSSFRGPLSWGQVELSSRPLTAGAVLGMLGQILPVEQRRLLDEIGAIELELESNVVGGVPFVVTAARGGDDVWVEVRRKPKVVEAPAIETPVAEAPPVAAEEPPAVVEVFAADEPATIEALAGPEEARPTTIAEVEEPSIHQVHDDVHEIEMPAGFEWVPDDADVEVEPSIELIAEAPAMDLAEAEPVIELADVEPALTLLASNPAIEIVGEEAPSWDEIPLPAAAAPVEPLPASTVVPIVKPALKLQPPPVAPAAPAPSTEASLVALLKVAVARGASTLYAVADARPMIRLDGEVALLGVEAAITGAEVDRFTFEFAPRDHVAEATAEWTCAVKGVGRVRSVTFRDDSGPGLIFHLPSPNVSTADELGLSARVQALCGEADGLVVIAGPRGSGKSTLLDAFVDLINRTRNDHVITIESHIRTAHEKRHSFISQRQSEPDGEAIAAAARAALREGPDVLVIEDLRAPEALSVALDAARAGRLVFGGIAAPTASVAIERLIGAYAADRRPQVRALLAGSMRAVVAQMLVRKPNGGRIGARELLLNSPPVEKLILDGATAQLPIAIEGGRRLGMVTMNDALGALVGDGVVNVTEACRCAPDRASLIAALERDGIDVSNVERWA